MHCWDSQFWEPRVVIMWTWSSLIAPNVVIATAICASSYKTLVCERDCHWPQKWEFFPVTPVISIDPSNKSQNALDHYTIMHHFVTEMRTHVHISVTKWCILGYGVGSLWYLSNRSVANLCYTGAVGMSNVYSDLTITPAMPPINGKPYLIPHWQSCGQQGRTV